MAVRILVHATFTIPEPKPLFVVAAEVLEGVVSAGMFLNIPLNKTLDITARIESIEAINHSFGLPLIGLTIRCVEEVDRQIMEAMNIGDEILVITHEGTD